MESNTPSSSGRTGQSSETHGPPDVRDARGAATIKRTANALASSGRSQEACHLLREKIIELSQAGQSSELDARSDELRDELRKLYQNIASRNNRRPLTLPPLVSERALNSASDRHTFTVDDAEREALDRELVEQQRQLLLSSGADAEADPDMSSPTDMDDDKQSQHVTTIEKANNVIDDLLDIFTCVICCKLMFQPVTTSCGHTFCRQCLCRAIEFTDTCPMCRTAMHIDSVTEMAVNTALQDAIETTYPTQYAARRRETMHDALDHIRAMRRLPIFPLDIVCFPAQKFPMHIFEQRYRLMLKRVMRGSRKFGIVHTAFPSDTGSTNNESERINTVGNLCKMGCIVEITKTHILQDGRSLISLKALDRFEIQSYSMLDEYIIADARIVHDEDDASNFSSSSSLRTSVTGDSTDVSMSTEEDAEKTLNLRQLEDKARTIVHDLVSRADDLPIIQRALQRAGQVPPQIPTASKGPEALGLWIASLLVNDDDRRQRLLQMCNSERRLREMVMELEKVKATCEKPASRVDCRPQ